MKITCVSDLHGSYPETSGGDLLIVAGDLTTNDSIPQWVLFYEWLDKQQYRKKVYIGGNHDNFLTQCANSKEAAEIGFADEFDYLCDSGTEFEGMKIWGSPWQARFWGQNPHCMAFSVYTEQMLAEKWALIPDDTNILITHSPPYGKMDKCDGERVGSKSLYHKLHDQLPELKLHVFGHIHSGYGISSGERYISVNAAYLDEFYEATHAPVDLEIK